jgi:pilus assembly protein CpaC
VRTRTSITILCFCAVSLIPCSALSQETKAAAPAKAMALKAGPPAARTATQQGTAQNVGSSGSAANIPAANSKDTSRFLSVGIGKSVVVDTPRPVKRISVGLGDLAEVTAISPTEVLINGKTVGETSLILWDVNGGRQFIHITVLPDTVASDGHIEAVQRELRTELPNEPLTISEANGSIFLRGTVKDLNSSDRAVQIASTAGKVINLLYVQVPPSDPQILLKVRFASVDRSLSKQLGINLFSTGLGNTIAGVNTGQFSPPSITTPSGTTTTGLTLSNELNLFAFFPGLDIGATIEAMESKGLVQVLSEPNLLAANGKKASFLAGGEYPYPVVQGSTGGQSAVTIMFKEYGVRLSFIPTVTPRGTIHLQLSSEVSSLDFTNAVEVSGFDVPAIDDRNVKTEIELGEGQSFAIGGLLDNRETETFQKIPFLGDIPIIGKFFQSISKTKNNTELIVIVTPEIVAPIPAGAPLPELKYPQKFMPPNSDIPMHTPDAKNSANTPPPAPPTMPVEQLIESMKPEKPLGESTPSSTSGGASPNTSGGSAPN